MKTLIPDFILQQFSGGRYHGHFQAATVYVDISGFTPLTETLFRFRQDGAEILGDTLSAIFGPLVTAVYEAGGFIPLFAGDAFTAIFPVDSGEQEEAAYRAWQAAQVIQARLMPDGRPHQFPTRYGSFAISVKIGLALGNVRWGIIGRDGQHSFYFRGSAVTACALAQLKAGSGQIMADKSIQHWLARFHPVNNQPLPPVVIDEAGSPGETFPAQPDLAGPSLARYLPNFIAEEILTLSHEAEFRHVCPVFISIALPVKTAVLDRFVGDVLRLTSHYGGILSQLEFGDKGAILFVYFGAPISHENDLLRAARCLFDLAETTRLAGNKYPRWRAGLSYGLVWAGFRGGAERQEYGLIGDVVNTAARISQEANWGEIWLAEEAAASLAEEYEQRHLGPTPLKGKENPQTLYRLLGPKRQINVTYQGKMIGRQVEIETLLQTAAPIFAAQFAGVGYVYGEAGMGKSRLLYELRQQLGDTVSWLYCPADEVLRQSLNPFRYYLRNYFRLSSENTAGNRQQFMDTLGDILFRLQALSEKQAVFLAGEIERTSSFLAALLDIYWPDSLYEQSEPKLRFANTLTALSSFIQAQAMFRPVIIQFEDFHWFDADSRHLLTTLCHDLSSYPAVLFLTSRFLDDGEAPAVPLPSATPQTSLVLDALDRTGVRALAEQLLGGPIDPDLLGFLVEKSDGRPFFAEQLTLELSEQAAIHHEANRFILLPEKVGTIPTTLNTLLISRLDRLTPSIKQVVQTAAILGERFLVPVLQEMLVQDNQLPEKLQSAAQRRIWVLHDELRYMFKHALLRDAAYEMQLQSRRRELHRLAAMNLEIIYAPHLGPYYGEIAHHYEKAWQQGLGTVRRQALHYLSLAAERAMNNFENEIALGYLGRALNLTAENEPEERYGLLLKREKIYSLLADLDSWEADLRALFALVNNRARSSKGKITEKTAKKAMVIYRWAWFDWHNGDYASATQKTSQALTLFRESNSHYEEGKCLQLLAGLAWEAGKYDQVTDFASQAIDLFRTQDYWQGVAGCLNTLGLTAADQGQYITAWDHYNEALASNKEDIENLISTLNNLGEVTCWLGLFDQAQMYIERGLQLARKNGNRQRQSILLLNLGIVAIDQGDNRLAQLYLNRSLIICREIGNRREEGSVLHNLAYSAALEGDLAQAQTAYEESLKIRRQLGQRQFAAEDQAGLAWVALLQGKREQALQIMDTVLAYLAENPEVLGAYKPLRVYWLIYRVARDTSDPRAGEILAAARRIIEKRAALILDPSIRHSYLTNVPENRLLCGSLTVQPFNNS